MGCEGAAGGGRELFEREDELNAIESLLAGAVDGIGGAVLMEGAAGIGKTSLLEAFKQIAAGTGTTVLDARATDLEAGFPYGVVRQLLEAPVRGASATSRRRLLAGAAELAGPVLLESSTNPTDPAEAGFAVINGLYWLLANLAGEAPVALVIDDLQSADEPSLRFLSYLTRRLDGLAVAVIASIRRGELGPDQRLLDELRLEPAVRVVSPAALSEAGVAAVLSAEFGQVPDPAFAKACHAVTAGNPFYIHELASALLADGIEPTAEATATVSDVAPHSIARVTLVRLGRLSGDAAGLVRAIAVLGSDAHLPRAAAIAALDEHEALAALDALEAAGVVHIGGPLAFRHPIVQAAIYEELSEGARSIAHRQAAALLAAEGQDLGKVASHLLRSSPVGSAETIATLREAARRAVGLGAPDNGATYLARALEEGPARELRAALLMELALAEKLARRPGALAHFVEARRLAADPALRAQAAIEQAEILLYHGEWEAFEDFVDEAIEETADLGRDIFVRTQTVLAAREAYDARLVERFIRRLPELEGLVDEGGPVTRPLALLLALNAASRDEPIERVQALIEHGWDGGRYVADGETIELLPQGIGAVAALDELDGAEEMVEAARAAAAENGSVMTYLVASGHAGWLHARRGNLTAAAAELRGCLELALELELLLPAAVTLSYATDVLLERPDFADLAGLTETIEPGPLVNTLAGAMLTATRGQVRFAAGDRSAAVADLRSAALVVEALRLSYPPGLEAWRPVLASMLDGTQRAEAVALVATELAHARRVGHRRRIGVALRVLGTLESSFDLGIERLEEAVTVLAQTPARLEYARALVELGAAHRRHGHRAAARPPLREGLDLAARCGAIRLADRAGQELSATGARPRRQQLTGRDALTPSELRVAQLAADGRTSQDIAESLFVTTRTVDSHLGHVYAKLGINSRRALHEALRSEV
jgi:DNA-binding CsgD family transcriptional regulator